MQCCQEPPSPPQSYCCGGGQNGGGFTGGCSQTPVWNGPQCQWQCENVSPIILDVDGSGYHLTDAAGGVAFDFFGGGHPIQTSWTAGGSTNAFLVLPAADGTVSSGRQLFGNVTPQPPCSGGRNGWNALAVYDEPANGGNGNGVIDSGDSVFSQLRLWQDLDHDGVAQPNEISTLPALGVRAISLRYQEVPFTDKFGNRFRYRAQVYGSKDSSLARIAYDVFFVVPY